MVRPRSGRGLRTAGLDYPRPHGGLPRARGSEVRLPRPGDPAGRRGACEPSRTSRLPDRGAHRPASSPSPELDRPREPRRTRIRVDCTGPRSSTRATIREGGMHDGRDCSWPFRRIPRGSGASPTDRRSRRAAPMGRLFRSRHAAAGARHADHRSKATPRWTPNRSRTTTSRRAPLDHFLHEGLITDVVRIVKTGKEASGAPACRGTVRRRARTSSRSRSTTRSTGGTSATSRSTADGEWIEVSAGSAPRWRRRRGSAARSRAACGSAASGRRSERCRRRGCPSQRPIASTGDAILMSYVGDLDLAAPQLRSIRPDPVEAQDPFEQVLRAIERMLYVNVIHGDLSAYNLLVWDGRVVVIDLPTGGRPAQESPRPGAARARRAADLRALRTVRGAIGAGPARGRPVDGVGVRRPRAGGAPDGASRCDDRVDVRTTLLCSVRLTTYVSTFTDAEGRTERWM